MNYQNLVKTAQKARLFAYAPYSNFPVGAALLCTDGTIFTGCNIENASYSVTNCAERTAFFTAIAQGYHEFQAIAVVGDGKNYCMPCGVCLQVMLEFCEPLQFTVISIKKEDDYQINTLQELLPKGFRL